MLRRDEEIILQEKTSEEQSMPLVVSELFNEVLDFVSARLREALDTSPSCRAWARSLRRRSRCPSSNVSVWVWLMHGERFEGFSSADRGFPTRVFAGGFQLAAQKRGERAHSVTGPSFSFSSTCLRTDANQLSNSVASRMVAAGSITRWALGSSRRLASSNQREKRCGTASRKLRLRGKSAGAQGGKDLFVRTDRLF